MRTIRHEPSQTSSKELKGFQQPRIPTRVDILTALNPQISYGRAQARTNMTHAIRIK